MLGTVSRLFFALALIVLAQGSFAQSTVLIRANTGATFPQLNHKLSLAISTNGLDWQSLHTTPTLTNFSRDASILRHGNEFVTVYSDDFALDPFRYSTNGTFGLARSTDLVIRKLVSYPVRQHRDPLGSEHLSIPRVVIIQHDRQIGLTQSPTRELP